MGEALRAIYEKELELAAKRMLQGPAWDWWQRETLFFRLYFTGEVLKMNYNDIDNDLGERIMQLIEKLPPRYAA